MKKSFSILATLTLLSLSLSAQIPAETKLYQKTIKSSTLKAYDKFLKNYPSSVYASEIRGKRDTLLHISPYSVESATATASAFFPEKTGIQAFGWRNEGKDYIIAFRLNAEGESLGDIRITDLEKTSDGWKIADEATYPMLTDSEEFRNRNYLDGSGIVRIGSTDWFHFTIRYSAENGTSVLMYNLYEQKSQSLKNIPAFCLKPKNGKTEYRIDIPFNPKGEEEQWLISKVKEDESMVLLSDADYKTDEAFCVWETQNPDALTSATKISAVILPDDCSLVGEFKACKRKTVNSQYKVAMFDYREKTVIVAFENNSGQHILEWVEPVCNNSRTDRLLNSISFKNGTTIEMFYYKGSRTFKYLLNLSSKSLRR